MSEHYPEAVSLSYDNDNGGREWWEGGLPGEVRGTHYTRTDTLPNWRTVAVDGMPEEGAECLLTSEHHDGFYLARAYETHWMLDGGGSNRVWSGDEYLILSELARLPGGGE